jgi:5-methylcytosine-specific restriction endonuclease McrA
MGIGTPRTPLLARSVLAMVARLARAQAACASTPAGMDTRSCRRSHDIPPTRRGVSCVDERLAGTGVTREVQFGVAGVSLGGHDVRVWSVDSGRWFRHWDDACAHLVSLHHGRNSEPLLDAVNALRHMDPFSRRRELALRHGWSCHLCGRPIPRRYRERARVDESTDSTYPNVEHLVPLMGGGADWWPNLRLAHRHCNRSKGGGDTSLGRDSGAFLKSCVPGYSELTSFERKRLRDAFTWSLPLADEERLLERLRTAQFLNAARERYEQRKPPAEDVATAADVLRALRALDASHAPGG